MIDGNCLLSKEAEKQNQQKLQTTNQGQIKKIINQINTLNRQLLDIDSIFLSSVYSAPKIVLMRFLSLNSSLAIKKQMLIQNKLNSNQKQNVSHFQQIISISKKTTQYTKQRIEHIKQSTVIDENFRFITQTAKEVLAYLELIEKQLQQKKTLKQTQDLMSQLNKKHSRYLEQNIFVIKSLKNFQLLKENQQKRKKQQQKLKQMQINKNQQKQSIQEQPELRFKQDISFFLLQALQINFRICYVQLFPYRNESQNLRNILKKIELFLQKCQKRANVQKQYQKLVQSINQSYEAAQEISKFTQKIQTSKNYNHQCKNELQILQRCDTRYGFYGLHFSRKIKYEIKTASRRKFLSYQKSWQILSKEQIKPFESISEKYQIDYDQQTLLDNLNKLALLPQINFQEEEQNQEQTQLLD